MTIILIRSIIIYIFVVAAVRIMGKRQVGELKPHELVITILISAVATVPLEDTGMPLANSLIPISIFICFEIIQSVLSIKSLKFRNLFQGKPIFIIKDGVLQQEEMERLRFTTDDIVDAVRQQGVFDISQVENAIVETNGNLSVQTKAEYSPVTPNDMGIKVEKAQVPITVVMDSKPVTEYFGDTKLSDSEIEVFVRSTEYKLEDILLMNVSADGNIYVIRKDKK